MATPEELLEENLTKPKKASSDAGSVEQHTIAEQIEAAKFLRSTKAEITPFAAIRRAIVSPGSAY